jgi:uncharacterized membrane protein
MTSIRRTAATVGVLFIIATVGFLVGQAIHGPVLEASDYLDRAYPERSTVVAGLLIELFSVLAIPLIPVALYPILRPRYESLAVGYLSFRIIEATLIIVSLVGSLSLVDVSGDYLDVGDAASAAFYGAVGGAVHAFADRAFVSSIIVFSLGALMLYWMLYRSNVVPRVLSVWGLIGAAILLAGVLLVLLGVASESVAVQAIVNAPIALNELALAVWLLAKGFTGPSAVSAPERDVDMNGARA